MTKALYVHFDSTSNAVLAKGLNMQDFQSIINNQPRNLLLLNPNAVAGDYDTHTGFRVIKEEQLDDYFINAERRKFDGDRWIDFSDFNLVQQLTPIEISELLYLGHTRTHLRSPFFYKLQNNYVFLKMSQDVFKIYYRDMEDFYSLLAQNITNQVNKIVNEKRSFFKKAIEVEPISNKLVKQLKPLMTEGIALVLAERTAKDEDIQMKIYIVEDRYRNVDSLSFQNDIHEGVISYRIEKDEWQLKLL